MMLSNKRHLQMVRYGKYFHTVMRNNTREIVGEREKKRAVEFQLN